MEINILIHGSSAGFNSQFMQFINTGLNKAGKETFGFDFDYIVNDTAPSKGFIEEYEKIERVISDHVNKGYTKINLIGKSLGGVFCLNEEIASYADKIVILGFPYSLGYPVELCKKLGKNASKVSIIQGTNDSLCDLDKLKKLNKIVGGVINIIIINNASHGFKPINADTTVEQNYNKVVSAILGVLG
ncbi:MAG: alpha/beta family hydrolase [Patescibacteria group bacterium]